MSNSSQPHGLYSPWNSQGQNTGVGGLSLPQVIFTNPGIQPRSPALQGDSLPAEPQGKPLNSLTFTIKKAQTTLLERQWKEA